jgi:hypothetical protein
VAITPLALPCQSFDDALRIAKTTPDLSNQSWQEVYECLDMFQIWRDLLQDDFGTVTAINHRSAPNDPPDLEFIFDNRVVGMEHTKLLPSHVGEADAWLRKSGKGGGLPSISSPPKNKDELREIVAGVRPAWSNVIDDWKTIFDLLAVTLRKKMGGMPNGGIIGVVCGLFVMDSNEQLLAQIAHDIVNRPELGDFAPYTLILLSRPNPSQFYSALVRRGVSIREQRGNPPPLSADDLKLLDEMREASKKL